MSASFILALYLVLFAVEFLLERGLSFLKMRHVAAHSDKPPADFEQHIDIPTYKKSVEYTLAKARFGLISSSFSALFLLFMILSGAFGTLDNWVAGLRWGGYMTSIAFVFLLALIFSLVSTPFSLYSTFVLEERFGFNRMTWQLYLIDTVKGLVLSAVLMTPLLLALFWFMDNAGSLWWIYAFAFMAGFQLLMVVLYPTVIAPIFNKFSPLDEGELKTAILALAEKIGFRTNGIFVMDGSKRSKHSNAYFTGLGRVKRIVFFDTLLEDAQQDEVLAVLAHEMGHEKKQHIRKGMLLSMAITLVGFWLLSLLLQHPPFFEAFGFERVSYHAALIIFAFCSGPFTFFLGPLQSLLSRKYEYEADRFAIDAVGGASALKQALLRLSKENLSNLTPHPWFSFYYYSHPTLAERLAAMDAYEAAMVSGS